MAADHIKPSELTGDEPDACNPAKKQKGVRPAICDFAFGAMTEK